MYDIKSLINAVCSHCDSLLRAAAIMDKERENVYSRNKMYRKTKFQNT